MSIIIDVKEHILFEDDFIIVINKPSSLMVEPDRNGYPNLLQQVQKYIRSAVSLETNAYAQHIHRLDRPVSGIVLFAKQKAVLKNLSEQFAERKVRKYYQALTERAPHERIGVLEQWHRKEKKRATIVEEGVIGAEKMRLAYSVSEIDKNKYVWDIELNTGKFHQIRVQLAYLGCPIVGDKLYGSEVDYKPDSIALHACKLVFFHPITNEEMSIEQEKEW